MRRLLLTMALLVLVGAVANLVVAIRATHAASTSHLLTNSFLHGADWPAPTPPTAAGWPAATYASEVRAFAYRQIDARTLDANSDTVCGMELHEFGWPLPVLTQVQMWWPWDDPKWATSASNDTGLVFSWPGLVVNPLLLATALWLLLFAPSLLARKLRQRLRRSRNQCLACGYPLGQGSVCPECGALATSSTHAPDNQGHV